MSANNPDYRWVPVPTNKFRYLRACMVCAIVLTMDEFTRKGCPNCHPVLDYISSMELAQECTSPIYEGCVSIDKPTESWIAKWLRLDKYVPGVYATKVVGELPEEALDNLSADQIEYIPRDGSENNLECILENVVHHYPRLPRTQAIRQSLPPSQEKKRTSQA
ncbi:hypothetical protein DRE_03015 [Drechslerella stenobrocha 248]|uniref:Transcription elongation factor SPT4 n=1 Tax=Drechslerella stenobrocha 248 TaxID=1043628 RepID=W7IFC1_9PEZI|nr:hypothetical protein DRE_03015 [Drechslerella stenobrocha 248]